MLRAAQRSVLGRPALSTVQRLPRRSIPAVCCASSASCRSHPCDDLRPRHAAAAAQQDAQRRRRRQGWAAVLLPGPSPTALTLAHTACGYATETPRLSRAERRRQERAKKKGRPLPAPREPAGAAAAAAEKEEKSKYGSGVELKGVTDLGIFKAIKHNFTYVCVVIAWPSLPPSLSPSLPLLLSVCSPLPCIQLAHSCMPPQGATSAIHSV
jgi:hypothetical protein